MNTFNPKKLLNSKWTAVQPTDREKHFIIPEVEYDDEGHILSCSIEAVLSRKIRALKWKELEDPLVWKQGWK
mgnify:CR=1 FL=1|jgi:tryptophan-rich hypothetical protein